MGMQHSGMGMANAMTHGMGGGVGQSMAPNNMGFGAGMGLGRGRGMGRGFGGGGGGRRNVASGADYGFGRGGGSGGAAAQFNDAQAAGGGGAAAKAALPEGMDLRSCPWKLFVGQVPFDAAESDLLAMFSQYGPIVDASILRKGGQSKGCGFVTYASQVCLAFSLVPKLLCTSCFATGQLRGGTFLLCVLGTVV